MECPPMKSLHKKKQINGLLKLGNMKLSPKFGYKITSTWILQVQF
jgi:hypothetical protein